MDLNSNSAAQLSEKLKQLKQEYQIFMSNKWESKTMNKRNEIVSEETRPSEISADQAIAYEIM